MSEIWRKIDGFSRYEVSNHGRVKSLARDVSNHTGIIHRKERILKLGKNHKGYSVVYMRDDTGRDRTMFVHRLVAIAFIPNPENKPQVNHKNGIKSNNFAYNLEWATNQENQIHAVKMGLNDHSKYDSGVPKVPVLQIDPNTGEVIAEYESVAAANRAIGHKCKSNISCCCRGTRETAGGYRWAYKAQKILD